MTVAELWEHYENMKREADAIERERDSLLDELQDLRTEMRETVAAIEAIQGEIDWG
jgi:hypothetical protein